MAETDTSRPQPFYLVYVCFLEIDVSLSDYFVPSTNLSMVKANADAPTKATKATATNEIKLIIFSFL